MKKTGPGHIAMAHVIDRLTAERRLAIQLEDATGTPLAHVELTELEARAFVRDLEKSIQKIWSKTP